MKNYLKNELKHLPFTIILFVLLYSITAFATGTTLFASSEVKYNNSTSGIQSDRVQGAIDELYACASNYGAYNTRLTNVENQIYPVGSIYISVNSTNPSTLFGGTWEAFGQGRTLIGVGSNGTDTFTINNTGGASTHTITTSNMPSHTHSFSGTTGDNNRGHTHTYTDYYANSPTGSTTIDFSNGHAFVHITASGWVQIREKSGIGNTASTFAVHANTSGQSDGSPYTQWAQLGGSQAHTHTVSNTSTSRTSNGINQNHTHTFSGTTGAAGSGTALSTIDPYITVYMWKRTA